MAGRAAVRVALRRSDLLGGGRPPRRRRLDLERRRARPGCGEMAAARRDARGLAISDFALVRQSRWREAIASIFDDPDFLPYLRSLRRIAVTYGDPRRDRRARVDQPRQARLPRRLARLAARAATSSSRSPRSRAARAAAARSRAAAPGAKPALGRGLAATLSDGRSEVAVVIRPVRLDDARRARRSASSCWASGAARSSGPTSPPRPRPSTSASGRTASTCLERHFLAARRGDVDLLAEAIEAGRRDPVSVGALRLAARLTGPPPSHEHHA